MCDVACHAQIILFINTINSYPTKFKSVYGIHLRNNRDYLHTGFPHSWNPGVLPLDRKQKQEIKSNKQILGKQLVKHHDETLSKSKKPC